MDRQPVIKKKRINSRDKGGDFELSVKKDLSAWSGESFERTPGSGGKHWKEDNNVSGDIVPPFRSKFPVSIECKKWEIDWDIDKLLLHTSEIFGFWNQCYKDSGEHSVKYPWLIISKNRRKKLLFVDYYFYMLVHPKVMSLPHAVLNNCENINGCVLVAFVFEDFLQAVSYKEVLGLAGKQLEKWQRIRSEEICRK